MFKDSSNFVRYDLTNVDLEKILLAGANAIGAYPEEDNYIYDLDLPSLDKMENLLANAWILNDLGFNNIQQLFSNYYYWQWYAGAHQLMIKKFLSGSINFVEDNYPLDIQTRLKIEFDLVEYLQLHLLVNDLFIVECIANYLDVITYQYVPLLGIFSRKELNSISKKIEFNEIINIKDVIYFDVFAKFVIENVLSFSSDFFLLEIILLKMKEENIVALTEEIYKADKKEDINQLIDEISNGLRNASIKQLCTIYSYFIDFCTPIYEVGVVLLGV